MHIIKASCCPPFTRLSLTLILLFSCINLVTTIILPRLTKSSPDKIISLRGKTFPKFGNALKVVSLCSKGGGVGGPLKVYGVVS